MDYNRYRYERQKKQKEAMKKQRENNKEMKEYCNLFSNFSSMKQNTVNIEGETIATSSSLYFIPANDKMTQNIFK